MDSWMRAAPIAMTAIGQHLLDPRLFVIPRPFVEPPSRYPVTAKSRQLLFAQSWPFSVKSYGGEFLPRQEARKPKARSPPAGTDLL